MASGAVPFLRRGMNEILIDLNFVEVVTVGAKFFFMGSKKMQVLRIMGLVTGQAILRGRGMREFHTGSRSDVGMTLETEGLFSFADQMRLVAEMRLMAFNTV